MGTAFFASVGRIAQGQIGPAAQAVEDTLVKILPVALRFLARLLQLDDLSSAIQEGLQKVQARVSSSQRAD